MDARTLARLNPWWSDPAGFDHDPSLERLAESSLRFDRSADATFTARHDAVFTLRGPRQVGKTTLLKQFLASAAQSGARRDHLLYLSCDLETPESLSRTLSQWLENSAPGGARRVVVLDEVSDVPGWPVVLRALWNQGLLRNVTLVASGSHALDLKRATETLPGRRGEGRRGRSPPALDQVLLSVPFKAFALARLERPAARDAVRGAPVFPPADLARSPGIARALARLTPFAAEIHRAFEEYLLCGGFPLPAQALALGGDIPPEVFRLHAASAGADLARHGLSERSAGQIARRITEILSTPVSWTTLVSGTDIRTHVTGKAYAEAFGAAFLVHEVPPFDLGTKQPVWQRERKLYPADPFVLHSLRAWGLGIPSPFEAAREFANDPASRGKLLESVVAGALARAAPPGLFSGLDIARRLTYLNTRGGREVDFVARAEGEQTPIEVKSHASAKVDRKAMSLVGPGIIVTLDETDLSARPRVIEAPFFVCLLDTHAALA